MNDLYNLGIPGCVSDFRNISKQNWLYFLIRLALAFLFIFSGINKLINPLAFAVIIDAFGLAPSELALGLAIIISILEIFSGSALLFDVHGSLGVISVLLGVFMLVLGYGIWMGLDVDCGCFGPDDLEAEAFHNLQSALYRDLLMVVGILYLYYWRFKNSIQPLKAFDIVLKIRSKLQSE